MKMLKLKEMQVTRDKFAVFKGHKLVNLESVKTISKYRHEGESVTRISFRGLPSNEDIWVQETPQQMALLLAPETRREALAEKDFSPTRVKVREKQEVQELPVGAAERQPAETEFDSMFEEIIQD